MCWGRCFYNWEEWRGGERAARKAASLDSVPFLLPPGCGTLCPPCLIAEVEVLPLRAWLGHLAPWPFLGPLAEPQGSQEVLFWWQQPHSQWGRTEGTQTKNLPSDPGSLLDQLLWCLLGRVTEISLRVVTISVFPIMFPFLSWLQRSSELNLLLDYHCWLGQGFKYVYILLFMRFFSYFYVDNLIVSMSLVTYHLKSFWEVGQVYI